MTYVGQIIDIFVSSPGDVSNYRDSILAIVQSWNQRNGKSKNLFFNCLRWEDFVAADIGDSGQDVINSQIGDDYDIFLGVMWARFGSPTSIAESGTEEEFDRAVERHQAGEPIKVSFLFCSADIPMANLDGNQFTKVQDFKKRAQEKGCLTRDFLDDASLINAINLILDKFANTWEKRDDQLKKNMIDKSHHDQESIQASDPQTFVPDDNSDDIADLGILDVLDSFSENNERFVESVNRWTRRLENVSVATRNTTAKLSDISKFGRPSSQQVRDIISVLTKEMDEFGYWCDNEIVELESAMENLSKDSLLIIDLSRDFDEPTEELSIARDALFKLYSGIGETNQSIIEFAETIEASPKLDKKLNKANRRVVLSHRKLVEKNRLFQENLALCVEDLTERLHVTGIS